MGAWGPGIFSDDIACDVRNLWRDLIAEGNDGPAATDTLLQSFHEVHQDPDAAPVFWLSLAVTQWRLGRLDPRVAERARAVLADGTAVRAWEHDPKLLRARRKALSEAAALLDSPPPPEKQLRRRFKATCDWQVGELIAFRLRSGRQAIFRVIGHHTDRGGTFPIVEVLDWCGTEIPPVTELAKCWIRSTPCEVPTGWESWHPSRKTQFLITEVSARHIPHDRLTRLGLSLPPAQRVWVSCGWMWRSIDADLERDVELT